MNWQRVTITCVAIAVAGALAWKGIITPGQFAALFGGALLPGPLGFLTGAAAPKDGAP